MSLASIFLGQCIVVFTVDYNYLRVVNMLALDPSCNKYCDLIGQKQVSISHTNLQKAHKISV